MGLLAIVSTTTASVAASAATMPTADLGSMITTTAQQFVASALPSAATTSTPVTEVAAQVPVAFEVTATFAGALAGALVGVRLRFDLVGVLTLAVISGLGGGIIRDVLLNTEVYALQNPRLLIAALAAALVVFFFFSLADRLQWSLFFVDAISLGIFAAIGSDKALLCGTRDHPGAPSRHGHGGWRGASERRAHQRCPPGAAPRGVLRLCGSCRVRDLRHARQLAQCGEAARTADDGRAGPRAASRSRTGSAGRRRRPRISRHWSPAPRRRPLRPVVERWGGRGVRRDWSEGAAMPDRQCGTDSSDEQEPEPESAGTRRTSHTLQCVFSDNGRMAPQMEETQHA